MIISQRLKLLFIHIPKCGGTTVEHMFDSRAQWNDLVIGGTPFGERVQPAYLERFGLHKHISAKKALPIIGQKVWNRMFKFTLVRNPWNYILSYYTWCNNVVKHDQYPFCNLAKKQSFADFVTGPALSMIPAQHEFIFDGAGRCLLDFIGRVETLQSDVRYAFSRAGINVHPLPPQNSSSASGDTSHYYDDRLIDAVARRYARDISLFGYGFNDFLDRPLPIGYHEGILSRMLASMMTKTAKHINNSRRKRGASRRRLNL
jgi:Sulfotransferase family